MASKIGVIHLGLGSIGIEVAKVVAIRRDLEIVGAVDVDPAKVGRDVGDVLGLGRSLGVVIAPSLESVGGESGAQVVLHTATSSFLRSKGDIEKCVRAGKHVVSTCEELSYPWFRHPEESDSLSALAKEHGVTIVGTGVNPGFVMDILPLTLSAPVIGPQRIRITRVLDAGKRRLPLQRKVGAGLTLEEFNDKVAQRLIRHVGLPESVALIAYGLGWSLEDVREDIEAKVCQERVVTPYLEVLPGQVAGIHQVARGIRNGREVITLDLSMYVGAKDPVDAISIDAKPPIDMKIPGGIHGDAATVAMVVNTISCVMEANPGLLTMADLPTVRARGG